MPRVSASTVVPGRVVEAEALWYDPHRWAAWIDGFGHVAKLEGEWPQVGARLLWDSRPQGRGRVAESVVAYEPRAGQTLVVCRVGSRSAYAAGFLIQQGIDAINLEGGLVAWASAGRELVADDEQSPMVI